MVQFNSQKLLKKSYFILVLIFLTFSSFPASAQDEEEAVKITILRFFEGMKKSDSAMIRSAVSATAVLQTIVTDKQGKTVVSTEDMTAFIMAVTRPHDQVYDERIRFDVVRVDAALALAWIPYRFYVGDTFKHCGVNSFQLVKLDGAWKIQYIIDTRRKADCL